MIFTPVSHEVDPTWVPQAGLVAPGGRGGLRDVGRNRYLLKLLVGKEIQARYSGSVLGMLWSYIMPLVRFAMYYFVIGLVLQLHKEVPNFALHIFCGLTFVVFFTETFSSGTRSILRNKAIVRKMSMPRELFPISAVIVSAIHMIPQAVIVIGAAYFLGWDPEASAFGAALLGLLILIFFGTGLALVFSVWNVFFRDFAQVVATLSIFTHWAVPMIYPYTRLSESELGGTWVEQVYLANPLAEAVLLLQRGFWAPTCVGSDACDGPGAFPADLFLRGWIMLALSILFLLACQWLFTRIEGRIVERL